MLKDEERGRKENIYIIKTLKSKIYAKRRRKGQKRKKKHGQVPIPYFWLKFHPIQYKILLIAPEQNI